MLEMVEYLRPGRRRSGRDPAARARRARCATGPRATAGSKRVNRGMHLPSTRIHGYLMLRLLARLRPWRRRALRFHEEQQAIERWLAALVRLLPAAPDFAAALAELPRVLKGYGDTQRRGRASFARIFDTLVERALKPDAVPWRRRRADASQRHRRGAGRAGRPRPRTLARDRRRHPAAASDQADRVDEKAARIDTNCSNFALTRERPPENYKTCPRRPTMKALRIPIAAAVAALALASTPVVAQDKPVEMQASRTGCRRRIRWPNSASSRGRSRSRRRRKVRSRSPLFPAQQLGKAPDHYDMARDGIADLTWVNPGYQAGRFPIFAAGELPFLIRQRRAAARWRSTSGTASTRPRR